MVTPTPPNSTGLVITLQITVPKFSLLATSWRGLDTNHKLRRALTWFIDSAWPIANQTFNAEGTRKHQFGDPVDICVVSITLNGEPLGD